MAENLYNTAHKGSTPAYRENWDQIKWDDPPEEKPREVAREKPPIVVFDESVNKYLEPGYRGKLAKQTQREQTNIHE